MRRYLNRVCDELLADKLSYMGAVLVEGPKWCGKTALAARQAKSVLEMQNPDLADMYLEIAATEPSRLLKGANPRLLDEWQVAPALWNAVRFAVDKSDGRRGLYILTGSATPSDDKDGKRHSGTGRIARLRMRPMSLFESLDSTGEVSLGQLFNDADAVVSGTSRHKFDDIAWLVCRGGWPEAVCIGKAHALKIAYEYVDAIVETDISRVDGIEKNPSRVRTLLRSLSRNMTTYASGETIMNDLQPNDTSLSDKTLAIYLNALRRLFVVEDVPSWRPFLRSKVAIRTAEKRNFVDPSIAAASLGASPDRLMTDFKTFGFFFESLCTRDMRVYAQANDGEVLQYHDKDELESDMVVQLRDGRWAAIEVKLGRRQEDEAAEHLKALKRKVDSEKEREASFLMVLTGTGLAYTRPDGVHVVPIGCLRP